MDIFEKSFEVLKKLVCAQEKEGFKFTLIGGWAVWLYNPYQKSRDIDLTIEKKDYWKLSNFLQKEGFSPAKSIHLGKKGFNMLWGPDKIEIDVYDEKIGRINISSIKSVAKKINSEKIFVASIDSLILLKIYSAMERLGTAKGEKDLSDVIALMEKFYKEIKWTAISNNFERKKFKDFLRVILGDFTQTKKIYPLNLENYKRIKRALKTYM